MPELPEVETVTNALRPHLVSLKISQIESYVPKLRYPVDLHSRRDILNQQITMVRRRAKHILIELENLKLIIMHLGMSGSCRIEPSSAALSLHDHVVFKFDNGQSLRFNDPRRFGFLRVRDIDEPGGLPPELDRLPPEPLGRDFTVDHFYGLLRSRSKSIKATLIDSQLVTGVGNIYACEALFHARIHPRTPANRISKGRAIRLRNGIVQTLTAAIKAGGTTIADFRSVDGTEGRFAQELRVYGRQGQLCGNCNDRSIARDIFGGRSTFYCPKCQRY